MQVKENAWLVESEKTKGKFYLVQKDTNGKVSCNCPDFFYRRGENSGACKHILVSGAMQGLVQCQYCSAVGSDDDFRLNAQRCPVCLTPRSD
jgi:SWIM zinc finger